MKAALIDIFVTFFKNWRIEEVISFPFITFCMLSSKYLVACWYKTLLSPSQVFWTSLSLYKTPSLLKDEYPWPPHICRHYLMHSVANQPDLGFSTEDIPWSSCMILFFGSKIFLWFLSHYEIISKFPIW